MALKGPALLEYLEANKGYDRDQLIEGAGFFLKRKGVISLQRTKFFEALAAANGHQLGPVPTTTRPDGVGKVATYRLKVGPNGMVPVSRAYTDQCEMQPGSYVRVVIEDGAIVLEPEVVEEGADPDAAPAARPAPVATLAAVA